jgi:hypothetical protein
MPLAGFKDHVFSESFLAGLSEDRGIKAECDAEFEWGVCRNCFSDAVDGQDLACA